MMTKVFWLSTLERLLKTVAQVLLGLLASSTTGLLDLDWRAVLATTTTAAAASVLTSIMSAGIGPAGSPSLVAESDGRHAAKKESP